MAGYNWATGMSNNAVDAYDRGLVPASKIKGIPASLIKEFCEYEEWHHSSARFNRVNFYDKEKVLATFGLIECSEHSAKKRAVDALKKHRQAKKAKNPVEMHKNCTVEWIEWGGSIRRPIPYECKESGCTVSVKGNTATITLKNGTTFVKRLSTRGFSFESAKDAKMRLAEERASNKRRIALFSADPNYIRVPAVVVASCELKAGGRAWAAIAGKKTIKGVIMMRCDFDFYEYRSRSRDHLATLAATVTGGRLHSCGKVFFFEPTRKDQDE